MRNNTKFVNGKDQMKSKLMLVWMAHYNKKKYILTKIQVNVKSDKLIDTVQVLKRHKHNTHTHTHTHTHTQITYSHIQAKMYQS